jgi:hypothetical protein
MEKLKKIIQTVGLDWSNTVIEWDSGSPLQYNFDVNPVTFLKFAYKDLQNRDNYGIVNAVTNAKRAIDCEVDKFTTSIGYSSDKLPKNVRDFNKQNNRLYESIKVPPKFQLLRSLGIAPITIICKIRDMRNLLEHQYQLPKESEASEAVEIAELFICTVEYALNNFRDMVWIYDNKNPFQEGHPINALLLNYDDGVFTVIGYKNGDKTNDINDIIIKNTNELFLELLRFVFAVGTDRNIDFALWNFLRLIEIDIQQNMVITKSVK